MNDAIKPFHEMYIRLNGDGSEAVRREWIDGREITQPWPTFRLVRIMGWCDPPVNRQRLKWTITE